MFYDLHQNNGLSPGTLSFLGGILALCAKGSFWHVILGLFLTADHLSKEKSPQKHWEYMAGTITSVQFCEKKTCIAKFSGNNVFIAFEILFSYEDSIKKWVATNGNWPVRD